jgi:4-amino-4-deoxy-L-arabinose transferase-like glycosyltransferase
MDVLPTRGWAKHSAGAWWREREVLLLLLVVVLAYLVRLNAVSLRGEEPRRAQVAFEMLQRDGWIVPREQGEPFLSRPPFHNWLIALSSLLCGTREPWALRLPSVLALLATSLLLYGYARTCCSPSGALAAAMAFVTLGEMFTTGCQAETEMVFIALVSASLLLWHWGEARGWPEMMTWVVCYLCVALGVLTKGPQPPVYFLGPVGAYLLVTGQWRRLFGWPHVAGGLAGAAAVGGWLLLFAHQAGWSLVRGVLLNDTAMRMCGWKAGEVACHLVTFPLEVLGCTLPWSLLLLAYCSRELRSCLGGAGRQGPFMALCVGLAFPTCWIPPEGQTRYFSPLYPCLAMLIGLLIDRCTKPDVPRRAARLWERYVQLASVVMLLSGAAVLLAPLFLAQHLEYRAWLERPPVALGYAGAVTVLALMTWRRRGAGDAIRVRTVVLAIACFMVLTLTGMATNLRIRRSADQGGAVARLKQLLPPNQPLVSIGHIDALFAYYYEAPIRTLAALSTADELPSWGELYFCFDSEGGQRPCLPFAWEEVATIPMDRNRHQPPERAVVVGHCLPEETLAILRQSSQARTERTAAAERQGRSRAGN